MKKHDLGSEQVYLHSCLSSFHIKQIILTPSEENFKLPNLKLEM